MGFYTKAQCEAEIAILTAAIRKSEERQQSIAGGPGAGQNTVRGDLRAQYAERDKWIERWEKADALEKKNSRNLARCPRPQ